MPLRLVVGPANAGKVALLLERYLQELGRSPVLVVPTRPDVERVERDLLARVPAILGGSIGTFDDLFERVAATDPERRPVVTDAQRLLLAGRAVVATTLESLGRSARSAGFADSLVTALGELESALLDPEAVDGDLGRLYGAYRSELERQGLWDRDLRRARAVARLQTDLEAWHGEPVFAYGFEDLTASEWALLEALAARTEVTVSLPYEPGRPAFASLRRTAEDLSRLAGARIDELPPRYAESAHPALAHLERALFTDAASEPVPIDGAVRFFEGAGARGALELVGEELLALLRAGTPPERIGIVCPSVERLRTPLDTALATLGVPYSLDGEVRLAQTPLGHAVAAMLRFVWLGS